MKKVKVKIYWLVKEKRIPPIIDVKDRKKYRAYCPIIKFGNQVEDGHYWSSVIFNNCITGKESIAELSYLVDNAPVELLKIDSKFELFEGNTKVAIGEVIEEIS